MDTSWLIAKEEKPKCNYYETELSINHIITECLNTQTTRRDQQARPIQHLNAALGSDADTNTLKLLKFLKNTKLYK